MIEGLHFWNDPLVMARSLVHEIGFRSERALASFIKGLHLFSYIYFGLNMLALLMTFMLILLVLLIRLFS